MEGLPLFLVSPFILSSPLLLMCSLHFRRLKCCISNNCNIFSCVRISAACNRDGVVASIQPLLPVGTLLFWAQLLIWWVGVQTRRTLVFHNGINQIVKYFYRDSGFGPFGLHILIWKYWFTWWHWLQTHFSVHCFTLQASLLRASVVQNSYGSVCSGLCLPCFSLFLLPLWMVFF